MVHTSYSFMRKQSQNTKMNSHKCGSKTQAHRLGKSMCNPSFLWWLNDCSATVSSSEYCKKLWIGGLDGVVELSRRPSRETATFGITCFKHGTKRKWEKPRSKKDEEKKKPKHGHNCHHVTYNLFSLLISFLFVVPSSPTRFSLDFFTIREDLSTVWKKQEHNKHTEVFFLHTRR